MAAEARRRRSPLRVDADVAGEVPNVPSLLRFVAREARALGRAAVAVGALPDRAAELSILLCDDATIRPLNRDWRGKDKATDVLSFPQEPPLLGDVVISVQTAAERVDGRRWTLRDELAFLLLHGLLHLLGHDHEADDERAEMERLEQAIWAARGRTGTLRG